MSTRDPYEVLGVPRDASTRQIRAAYVERARRAHPDLVGRRGLDVMRALNEAWDVLKDAERRAAYDAGAPTAAPGAGAASGAAAAAPAGATGVRQPWTGAAGPPPGRPWGPVLSFGIYAGWSLGEVARRDRGYLLWLRDRPEAKEWQVEIAHLLNPEANPMPQPGRTSRRR